MSDNVPDLSALLQQAQAMQEQLVEAQEAIAKQEVVGVSGGGAVRITATGGLEFRAVRIDPNVLEDADATLIEDLMLAALMDVTEKANELNASALGGLAGLTGLLG